MITELSKRRVFRVISGYAVVCFVILQIADVAFEPLGIGDDVLRVVIAGMLLALPLVAYLSWIFDVDPESKLQRSKGGRPWLEASITLAALVGLAIGTWFVLIPPDQGLAGTEVQAPLAATSEHTSAPLETAQVSASIAVLPFANLSDDSSQEYFSDGITEDIINGLARNTSLVVRPRSSSFALKGKNLELQLIGQRLNVTHVLEGSVRRSGKRVRVTLQLSEVASNQSIWSDRHEGELTDIFEVQDKITRNVVSALKAEFIRATLPSRFPGTAAYDAFLLARYHFVRLGLLEAERLLKVTTELDPVNADAWALLARVVTVKSVSSRTPNSGEFREARVDYLNRALAIDPTHPNALALEAWWVFVEDKNYQKSIESLVKLAEDNPNNTDVPLYLNMFLNTLGKHSLALKALKKMELLDPIGSQYNQVEALLHAEDLQGARQRFDTFFGDDPGAQENYAHIVFQMALIERDIKTMRLSIESNRMSRQGMYPARKALVQLLEGNQALAQETLEAWADTAKYRSFYVRSRAALVLGHTESAIRYWREGMRTGDPATAYEPSRYAWKMAFPEFYSHPEYKAMLVEFGLDTESISKIKVPELPF